MNKIISKLKLIFVPFVIIAISIIGGYTFLNWFLFIKLHAFSIKEEAINFWIPALIPWIPIFIWLRPRIKLLNSKRKKVDLVISYFFISGIAIAIPTIIAQSYLETASGKLTVLDNINQIEKQINTKYYSLKNSFIDKLHYSVLCVFDVSGKNNDNFDMNLYMALPIFNSAADTTNSSCIAWYGVKYYEQISNRLDEDTKKRLFVRFANESLSDFKRKNINQFVYFDRIGNTKDHQSYNTAIRNNKKYKSNSTIVLIPVNESFESINGHKLEWIFGALGIGAFVWFIMIIIPNFDEKALKKFLNHMVKKETDTKDILTFFLPREGFYITPIIIDLNILVFIIMVFSGLGFISFKGVDLLAWGANFKPLIINGEWWRLLTNTFLHGGLMHLLANMYGLFFVGIFLEPRLGKVKYAIIYLITGILASITSIWWHDAAISVGASGAIFGLYGVFLALLLTKIYPKEFSNAFLVSTLIFVGYNLLMGLSGGIDNAAHIGGLLSGFIIGLILYPQLKRQLEDDQLYGQKDLSKMDN